MQKPKIQPTADNAPFWQGCRENTLRYQQCGTCKTVQLIPRGVCTQCHSQQLDWKVSAGLGRILSHTTVYRAPTPAFKADVPYVIALVDMAEGFRLMVNVRTGKDAAVAIGKTVRIGFRESGENVLPEAEVLPS
ncbi:OB-fold domain-containing protein [Pollutimonas bauzanensis]|uniref:Zn-ribbon domain-containing OB-fold protein n=1 Tax=Pollutimonas bauzanensis TaxID=658167 RepID=UPI0033419582